MNTSLKAELDPSNNSHFTVTKSGKSFGKEEHVKTATAKHNDFQGNAKLIKYFFIAHMFFSILQVNLAEPT